MHCPIHPIPRYLSHSTESSGTTPVRPHPLLDGRSSMFPIILNMPKLLLVVFQILLERAVSIKALVPLHVS
jgi:hypothetical protein